MKKIMATPRQFFLTMLLLPILAPTLFALLHSENAGAILLLSLTFGGVQYLIFAATMTLLFVRTDNIRLMRQLVLFSPLLYVPLQGLGWILWRMVNEGAELNGVISELIIFGIYSIFVGYAYVAITSLLYFIGATCGFIAMGQQASASSLSR